MTVPRRPSCALCGAAFSRASTPDSGVGTVCGGCAERLELDLTLSDAAACPNCGRHQELCSVLPCVRSVPEPEPAGRARPVKLAKQAQPRRISGRERVLAIESLAATRLGVRELSRRTGFAPPTISRWLKIGRRAALKRALESGLVDIGRAKVLVDAPEESLAELIETAPRLSRTELASRVANLRSQTPAVRGENQGTDESRRLRSALTLLESITDVNVADGPLLQRLHRVVEELCRNSFESHSGLDVLVR